MNRKLQPATLALRGTYCVLFYRKVPLNIRYEYIMKKKVGYLTFVVSIPSAKYQGSTCMYDKCVGVVGKRLHTLPSHQTIGEHRVCVCVFGVCVCVCVFGGCVCVCVCVCCVVS